MRDPELSEEIPGQDGGTVHLSSFGAPCNLWIETYDDLYRSRALVELDLDGTVSLCRALIRYLQSRPEVIDL